MTEENRARVLGGIPDTEDEGGVIWTDYLKEVTPEGEVVWEWHGQDASSPRHNRAASSGLLGQQNQL